MADIEEGAQKSAVDELYGNAWERRMQRVLSVHFALCMASICMLMLASIFGNCGSEEVAKFSVELAGFQGLNATLGHTVSPSFRLKVRVENPRAFQPWCSNGGESVVSYSGVALAWGQVPDFCVKKKAVKELMLLPSRTGVGLSDDLRRRLASELLAGTTQVRVHMNLFNDANGWSPSSETYSGTLFRSFQLMLT